MKKSQLILYKSSTASNKRIERLKELCGIDKSSEVKFYNIENELITDTSPEPLVYLMGEFLPDEIPFSRYLIVGEGIGVDQLADKAGREAVIKDLSPGENNVFEKHSRIFLNPNNLLNELPPTKLSQVPREPNLPSLEGSIDDAISAVQYLKLEGIHIALPELNTFISEDSTQNSLSYDELLGLLLVFKRLGADKLYWKDKAVFPDKK